MSPEQVEKKNLEEASRRSGDFGKAIAGKKKKSKYRNIKTRLRRF